MDHSQSPAFIFANTVWKPRRGGVTAGERVLRVVDLGERDSVGSCQHLAQSHNFGRAGGISGALPFQCRSP